MAVDIYQGALYQAEDAKNYIDKVTIDEGCRMLKEASEKLSSTAKKIQLLKEICSREALSVQGVTMEDMIEEFEYDTNEFSLYISDLADTLSSTTQRVVNRKQIILNEEAKKMDSLESSIVDSDTQIEIMDEVTYE